MSISTAVDEYIEKLPRVEEVREMISENRRRQRLLKELLKLSEQRESLSRDTSRRIAEVTSHV